MLPKLDIFTIFATCMLSVNTLYNDYNSNVVNQLPDDAVKNVGKFQPRIVGGSIPRYHEMPFVVYIQCFSRIDQCQHCTGSIIASRYVLTAFHCLVNPSKSFNMTLEEVRQKMLVKVGSMYKKRGRSYKIASYYHFKTKEGDTDMVVLKLDDDVKYTNGTAVSPVIIGRWTPKAGDVLTIAGHGQHIANGRIQKEDCYVLANVKVASNETWEGNVGFYAIGNNQGPAHGDSGGPAVKLVNGQRVQVGMISAGGEMSANRRDTRVFGKFILIAPYCNLIQEKTNGSARCQSVNK